MTTYDIQIVVSGKDDATGVLDKVSRSLKDVGDEGSKSSGGLKGINEALGALGVQAISAAGVIGGLVGAYKFMVGAAAEAQTIQAQLNAVINSTGGAAGVSAEHVNSMAKAMQDLNGVEDDAIIKGANVLLTFTNIGAVNFDAAMQAAIDLSKAMGQDLQSSIVQIGKALNDTTTGLSSLQRVGVTFTQSQKDAAKAMQDAGNAAGAQAIVLAELNKEFGGSAAAAANTYAGSMEKLKITIGNLGETIGGALLPTLTSAANAMTTLLTMTDKIRTAAEGQIKTLATTAEGYRTYKDGVEAAAKAMLLHVDASGNLVDGYNRVQSALHLMSAETWLAVQAEQAWAGAGMAGVAGSSGLGKVTEEAAAAMAKMTTETNLSALAISNYSTVLAIVGHDTNVYALSDKEAALAASALAKAQADAAKAADLVAKAAQTAATNFWGLAESMKGVGQAAIAKAVLEGIAKTLDDGTAATAAYRDALLQLAIQYGLVDKASAMFAATFPLLQDAMKNIPLTQLNNALDYYIKHVGDAGFSWEEFCKKFGIPVTATLKVDTTEPDNKLPVVLTQLGKVHTFVADPEITVTTAKWDAGYTHVATVDVPALNALVATPVIDPNIVAWDLGIFHVATGVNTLNTTTATVTITANDAPAMTVINHLLGLLNMGPPAPPNRVPYTGPTTQTPGTTPNRVPVALGGPVWANAAYLVGERGPEPFVPSQNGTIVTNAVLDMAIGAVLNALELPPATPGYKNPFLPPIGGAWGTDPTNPLPPATPGYNNPFLPPSGGPWGGDYNASSRFLYHEPWMDEAYSPAFADKLPAGFAGFTSSGPAGGTLGDFYSSNFNHSAVPAPTVPSGIGAPYPGSGKSPGPVTLNLPITVNGNAQPEAMRLAARDGVLDALRAQGLI